MAVCFQMSRPLKFSVKIISLLILKLLFFINGVVSINPTPTFKYAPYKFYKGQGLGNQLWMYCALRSIASSIGYRFAFVNTNFLRFEFPWSWFWTESSKLSFIPGRPSLFLGNYYKHYYRENFLIYSIKYPHHCLGPDLNLYSLPPNTLVDGNFQVFLYLSVFKLSSWMDTFQALSKPLFRLVLSWHPFLSY